MELPESNRPVGRRGCAQKKITLYVNESVTYDRARSEKKITTPQAPQPRCSFLARSVDRAAPLLDDALDALTPLKPFEAF